MWCGLKARSGLEGRLSGVSGRTGDLLRTSPPSHEPKFAILAKEAVYRMVAMSRSSWRRSLCPGLDPEKVERAVTLSTDIYISATIMLGEPADITYDNEVVDTGGAGA